MQNSPTISLGTVTSVTEFYEQLSAELFHGTRHIRNADALADVLQEMQIVAVRVHDWSIPLKECLVILTVFSDLGITLQLGSRAQA